MLSKIATFSECNLSLPCSALRFARMGYVFNLKAGSITCSSCEFVVELQSHYKDFKSAPFDSIQSQHGIKSPHCVYSRSEKEISAVDEQADSGFGSTLAAKSILDTGGGSKELGENEQKINIFTADLEQILPKGTNNILKRTVESMKARLENREKLKNVDISGTSSSDDNNFSHDVTDSASAVTRTATTVPISASPTDAEILQKSKHPALAYEGERRKTFNGQEHKYGHMATTGDKIKQFVDAGFYYIGPNDNVRCFFCDGGLVNFRDDDDPWTEHKRWYADCLYIKYKESKNQSMQRDGQNILNRTVGDRLVRSAGNSSNLPFEPVRALDSREIKARLETPIIQTLLSLGYQREHIRRALERRLTSVGDDFKSVEELVEDILKAEGDSALPKPGPSSATASASGALNASSQLSNSSQVSRTSSQTNQSSLVPQNVECTISSNQSNGDGNINTGNFSNGNINANISRNTSRENLSSNTRNFDGVDGILRTAGNPSSGKNGASGAVGNVTVAGRALAALAADNIKNSATSSISAAEAFGILKNCTIQDEGLKSLLREYEQLSQTHTCKICLDSLIDTVFLPCGHLVSCHTCAPQITHCCICRSLIRGTVRALTTDFDSEGYPTPSIRLAP